MREKSACNGARVGTHFTSVLTCEGFNVGTDSVRFHVKPETVTWGSTTYRGAFSALGKCHATGESPAN